MKNVLGILLVFFALTSIARAEKTLNITTGEWPPYLSTNLPHDGLIGRIVRDAFALEGLGVNYSYFPWERALNLAKNGSWSATAVWSYKEKRTLDFLYSDPVIKYNGVFFSLKKNNFDWEDYEDLKDVNVGITFSYYYNKRFDEAKQKGMFKYQTVNDDITNFKKLIAGRIDIFPSDLYVGYEILANNFSNDQLQQITHHPKPYNEKPIYVLFAKNNPKSKELLKKFNRGLKALKASGAVQRYLNETKLAILAPNE